MCVIAHIDRNSIQVCIGFGLNDRVTLAGFRLQTAAIKNRNHSSTVTNQFAGLQRGSGLAYAFAPHTQHVGIGIPGSTEIPLLRDDRVSSIAIAPIEVQANGSGCTQTIERPEPRVSANNDAGGDVNCKVGLLPCEQPLNSFSLLSPTPALKRVLTKS